MTQIELNCQVLPLRGRVDLGAIGMKKYSSFPKAPTLQESHHQIGESRIKDIRYVGGGGLALLQGYRRCNLQHQLSEILKGLAVWFYGI